MLLQNTNKKGGVAPIKKEEPTVSEEPTVVPSATPTVTQKIDNQVKSSTSTPVINQSMMSPEQASSSIPQMSKPAPTQDRISKVAEIRKKSEDLTKKADESSSFLGLTKESINTLRNEGGKGIVKAVPNAMLQGFRGTQAIGDVAKTLIGGTIIGGIDTARDAFNGDGFSPISDFVSGYSTAYDMAKKDRELIASPIDEKDNLFTASIKDSIINPNSEQSVKLRGYIEPKTEIEKMASALTLSLMTGGIGNVKSPTEAKLAIRALENAGVKIPPNLVADAGRTFTNFAQQFAGRSAIDGLISASVADEGNELHDGLVGGAVSTIFRALPVMSSIYKNSRIADKNPTSISKLITAHNAEGQSAMVQSPDMARQGLDDMGRVITDSEISNVDDVINSPAKTALSRASQGETENAFNYRSKSDSASMIDDATAYIKRVKEGFSNKMNTPSTQKYTVVKPKHVKGYNVVGDTNFKVSAPVDINLPSGESLRLSGRDMATDAVDDFQKVYPGKLNRSKYGVVYGKSQKDTKTFADIVTGSDTALKGNKTINIIKQWQKKFIETSPTPDNLKGLRNELTISKTNAKDIETKRAIESFIKVLDDNIEKFDPEFAINKREYEMAKQTAEDFKTIFGVDIEDLATEDVSKTSVKTLSAINKVSEKMRKMFLDEKNGKLTRDGIKEIYKLKHGGPNVSDDPELFEKQFSAWWNEKGAYYGANSKVTNKNLEGINNVWGLLKTIMNKKGVRAYLNAVERGNNMMPQGARTNAVESMAPSVQSMTSVNLNTPNQSMVDNQSMNQDYSQESSTDYSQSEQLSEEEINAFFNKE